MQVEGPAWPNGIQPGLPESALPNDGQTGCRGSVAAQVVNLRPSFTI
jgi:hypothetical protein